MDLTQFDFIIVGAGFFGSVVAERIARGLNKKVLVLEKRNHIGGNCFSEDDPETGIHYHKYGTHIFHTSNPVVWDYFIQFTEFNQYHHQVLTTYKNRVFQMPINLETINDFYRLNLKPYEVDAFLKTELDKENYSHPENFEEKAVSLIGRPLYEAFIRGYTLKQWQMDPKFIPASTLTRLPFRKNYDESYYYSRWQGIPLHGFGDIFKKLLDHPNISVKLNTDYFDIRDQFPDKTTIIYTGPIDKFFDYKLGRLEYRTLVFEREVVPYEDFQGTSVMNYAEESVPYTRIHEPRHLHPERTSYPKDKSLIFREYSKLDTGENPYYPINDQRNNQLLLRYRTLAKELKNVIISGRLGAYKYYDMHDTIANALSVFDSLTHKVWNNGH
ncbi:MAG: UDP-galactopyranose mutase [Bacteroidales bacterium]|nr:UDP-galactopyranose mutase [Bacteroidales bacterium]